MAEDFQIALQRSIAVAGSALAEALPPSVLDQATLTAHAQGLADLERGLFTTPEWNDERVQETLHSLEQRAAEQARRADDAGSALSMSVVALATALKVYGNDPRQVRSQALPQAVVLARAYADAAAALTPRPDEAAAEDASRARDREDVKPVVTAIVDMIRYADAPDRGAPLVGLVSECLVGAAQAPSASSPWALMRVYGSRLATCVNAIGGGRIGESEHVRAAGVGAKLWKEGASARDAFARSLARLAEVVGSVTSADGFDEDAVGERLLDALGCAASAAATFRTGE
jgi:hypothetical protein